MKSRITRRAALASSLAPLFAAAPPASTVTLQHVTIVDVANGTLRRNQTIHIKGDRIASIVPAGPATSSAASRGPYVIPGLWDMHTHLWTDPPLFGLYLKNGVTGIRDMGSIPLRTRAWRRQISSGQMPGPRIITAGTPIDGPGPRLDAMPTITAATPEEARRAGDEWEKERVDFIKVLGNLSPDAYNALASEARQMRWPMAGHLPTTVAAQEAVYARQESIEHMFGLLISCSGEEWSLRKAKPGLKTNQRILETYHGGRARDLFDLMRRYDTCITPTLVLHRRMAQLGLEEIDKEPQLALIPEAVKKTWTADEPKLPAAEAEFAQREFAFYQRIVRDMQAVGVRILAGTDTGDPKIVPGASLHDELAQMVDAGLTPLQALQTATRNPAIFLHLEDRLGSVERGKYADLVLLEENPLTDIRHTRRVTAVVMAGRHFDRRQLDALVRV